MDAYKGTFSQLQKGKKRLQLYIVGFANVVTFFMNRSTINHYKVHYRGGMHFHKCAFMPE